MNRLTITKTPKVYVGGAFIRSESGRVFALNDANGNFFANIPQCTRKDLRNAVEAAAKAGPAWAKRTPYNRAQIIYRLAEMIEARSSELVDAIILGSKNGTSKSAAEKEVAASIDRLVYFAGWADKYEQVLGNVNPVAAPYFNFSVTEPMGIVGVIAPQQSSLLGLISLFAPAIVAGNTIVAAASESKPYPAIVLGEMLATSDLPAGVVNILTGFHKELIPTFATHAHIRSLVAEGTSDELKTLALGAAETIKRLNSFSAEDKIDWFSDSFESVYRIQDTLELKTVWHPIGA